MQANHPVSIDPTSALKILLNFQIKIYIFLAEAYPFLCEAHVKRDLG